ncbi:hypothetical protein MNBD_GAMMA10-1866 [hydrothermal vent metagenome]|uniref:Uncharacterized protein n=1 Tax=hydrothermal vent metagenome TaxID=652676 RepID=A0A3B0Y470_9ZZZZ
MNNESKASESIESPEGFHFTPTGKLRKENDYLKQRVTNLEAFKKNFFTAQADLIKAREKLALQDQQLNMDKLRDRIVSQEEEAGATDKLLVFFQQSLLSSTYKDLVASLFNAVEGTDISLAVQLHSYDEYVQNYFTDTDKEKRNYLIQLINQHKNQPGDNGVVDSGDYFSIHLDYMSLLAESLPSTDSVKLNQLKEYLKIITMGANSRLDTLIKSIELEDLRKNVYKIFKKTNSSFESMQDDIDTQIISISDLYLGFEASLNKALKKMKLNPEFMNLIKLLLYDMRSELNLILTSSLTVDEDFMKTIKKLEKAYSTKYSE